MFESAVLLIDPNGEIIGCPTLKGEGFTVLPLPTITSFYPTQSYPTFITITGTNFINLVDVKIGGQHVFYIVNSPTDILVFASRSGLIEVVTEYGFYTSSSPFIVTGRS